MLMLFMFMYLILDIIDPLERLHYSEIPLFGQNILLQRRRRVNIRNWAGFVKQKPNK